MTSRRSIAAAALAAVVVLAVGAGLGARLGRPGGSAGPGTPAATAERGTAGLPASAATPAAASATAAGVSQAGLRWVDFHGVRLPVSASAGPGRESPDGAAAGFADTPLGAALAALHITVRLDARFGPRVYRPTLAGQVTGPDKAAAAANVEAAYAAHRRVSGTPPGQATGPVYVTVVGFRFEAFTPASALVHLLLLAPAGTAAGWAQADYRAELRWAEGDWRLVAPPAGNWQAVLTVVADAAGYTRFGG